MTARTTCSSALMALAAMTFLASAAFAADWTQFRGPTGLGQSDEKSLPVTWDDTNHLAWRSELPGHGASSVIVVGDHLYVTCYSGYGIERSAKESMENLRRQLVCLRKSDGQQVWVREIMPRLPESREVRDHGYAASTPASDGQRIYVFFGKTGVLAFDLSGTQLWQADVGSEVDGWGSGTSPILWGDYVIVNASVESGKLIALHRDTGEKVWEADGMEASWNTPHLVQGLDGPDELVVSVKGQILAFDPASGDRLWNCAGIEDYVCPSCVSADGVVYAIGGRSSRALAIRAGGRGDVSDTHLLWEAKAGANVASPVIVGDYLYWVSDRNQAAYCLDRRTGEVMYEERMRGQPYASALAADGKLYVVTRDSGTFVLDAKPQFKQLAHNRLTDETRFDASPAVADGALFLRSEKFVYCISNR